MCRSLKNTSRSPPTYLALLSAVGSRNLINAVDNSETRDVDVDVRMRRNEGGSLIELNVENDCYGNKKAWRDIFIAPNYVCMCIMNTILDIYFNDA